MHGFISIIDIISYNLINLILTINKLIGPNYVDWKRNLDIVLTSEEIKWVIKEISLSTPNEHSTQEEKDNYHSWQRADQKTKCIILGSLDNVLQHQHVFMPTTYDILVSLHEMFGGKGRPTKQVALKAIMDTKILEGTPIRDHMIRMIRLFNQMKIIGDKMNGETQVDTFLETLSDSFKQFKLNYNMNKMVMSLIELMRELQMVEGILKDQKGIHMVVKGSSSSSSQKNKNTIESTKQKGKFKGKGKKKKSKGQDKCFLCGKKGHRKRNALSS